jgi:hypothetical protein
MECRFVPVRVRDTENALGFGRDGPVHAQDHRVWHARRNRRWQANLRILQVEEIKTTPYVPLSHPFVERLIGTIRRECLDLMLFWTCQDLESKLRDFQDYYNRHRTHSARAGCTPHETFGPLVPAWRLSSYGWRRHCGGLYQTPLAA